MTAHSTPGGGAIGTAPELEEMPPTDPAETLAELLHLWCVSDDLPIPDLAADDLGDAPEPPGTSATAPEKITRLVGALGRRRYHALSVAGRITPTREAQIALLLGAVEGLRRP